MHQKAPQLWPWLTKRWLGLDDQLSWCWWLALHKAQWSRAGDLRRATPDPRLASVQLLTLAAMRAQQRRRTQPDPFRVVALGLDGLPEDPADEGRSPSGIYLPRKAASVEEWAASPLVARFRQQRGTGGLP
jgi:hypothetical protein